MAKKPNPIYCEQIKLLNSQGLLDSEIARELKIKVNLVQHYRQNILKLKPNWIKRNYLTNKEKLCGYIIRNLKSSAKRRNIPFDLIPTDLILPTHCPILGLELEYNSFDKSCSFNNPNWATVDRIDSSKGYVKGNVWVISRMANTMKSNATPEQLEMFCISMLKLLESHRALGSITDPVGLDC